MLIMLLKVEIFVLVVAVLSGDSVSFGYKISRRTKKCLDELKTDFRGRISERKCDQYLWEKKRDRCYHPYGITNGKSTNIIEFPHMAAIGWDLSVGEWDFKCGGSLISHHFVLTAAHCTLNGRFGLPKIVRLGATIIRGDTHNSGEKPVDIKIKRIIKHPKYNPPKKYFDIALLELSEVVNFTDFIQPACLWTKPEIDPSMQYFVSGWGQLAYNGPSPNYLQSAVINIVEKCEKSVIHLKHRHWHGLSDHQMCAGDEGIDTCQGDSGAPLQFQFSKTGHELDMAYQIVAITMFGKECGIKEIPGIYTKVYNFINWIEKHVWPQTSNPSEDQTVNDNTNGKPIGENWFVSIIPVGKEILDNYLNSQSNDEDNLNELNWLVRLRQVAVVNQARVEGELKLNNDKENNYPKISTKNQKDENADRLIFPDEFDKKK